ncbi:MAG: GNAT family N-acetyltransferase [Limnochordaceae bacterium]|nr:GNAT family N-acetyltransferase [Limnochordaceae bacterium]
MVNRALALARTGIRVRRANWRDKEAILELLRILHEQVLGVKTPPRMQLARILDQHLDSPLYSVLVAEWEGELPPGEGTGCVSHRGTRPIVGLLSLSFRSTLLHAGVSGLLDELVVAPGYRNQGVARVLVEEAFRVAQAAGCHELEVSTQADNESALALYESAGFVRQGIWLEREFDQPERG